MKIILFSAKAQCVDCDTEFFNGHQWKKISNYNEDDMVLQYNDDGSAELVKPIDYIAQPTEYLYNFETPKLNMCLSEGHECYYITDKNNLYHKPYSEIMKCQLNNVNGFPGRFITSFNYGDKGIDLTDDEIQLMCAVICDSSFIRETNRCFFNLKKDRKKDELRKLLNRMNCFWEEKEYDCMPNYIRFILEAPRKEKEFNTYWYKCNHHQLEVICNNIIKWDGHVKSKTSFDFSTTNKQTADFIQFAFSACGYRANILTNNRMGEEHVTNGNTYARKSIDYTVSISKNTLVTIFNRHKPIDDFFKKYKTLDGYSYCFTVPSHKLVLRRNNKIFITGNCGKDTSASILKEIMEQDNKKVLITHYADLLKFICKNMFNWNGEKDDTGRSLLQRVGTDVIRKQNPDYWVSFISEFLKLFPNEWDYVLIPDCRFPNEVQKMIDDGWDVFSVRINRIDFESSLTEEQKNHISETALDNYQFDYYIDTISDLGYLKNKLISMYYHMQENDDLKVKESMNVNTN